MSWLIPGTLAVVIAGATSLISLSPIPTGPVKACTSIAVMADYRVVVVDCEGAR